MVPRKTRNSRDSRNYRESSGSFDVWQAQKQGEKTNKTKH